MHRTRSFLGALVDLFWDSSLYAQLDPQGRFENTLGALKTLIKAESLCRPVVLVLEDAQWLDEDSKAFVGRHDDMPNENIIAMIETGKKYGTYPLHID